MRHHTCFFYRLLESFSTWKFKRVLTSKVLAAKGVEYSIMPLLKSKGVCLLFSDVEEWSNDYGLKYFF